jgi:AcrR family transcriptional regulator
VSESKNKTEAGKAGRRVAPDLLDAGLNLLAEYGIEQLTIDALCKHLCVTKGSFYHHFKNRDEYLERMLEHWVQEWVLGRFCRKDEGMTATERFQAVVAEADTVSCKLETSIRTWAQRDPVAQRYLERVDGIGMDYMCDIFEELTGDRERAVLLSRIDYVLFVGTRMVAPPITGDERRAILRLVGKELYGMDFNKSD